MYLPPRIHLTVEADWHVCRVHPAHFKILRLKSKPFPTMWVFMSQLWEDWGTHGTATVLIINWTVQTRMLIDLATPLENLSKALPMRGGNIWCVYFELTLKFYTDPPRPAYQSNWAWLSSGLYWGGRLSSPEVAKWEQLVKSVVLACWIKCRLPYYNQPYLMGVLEN